MEENEKIFEKARFLGIPVEGDSAEEKLQNIANHVGLPYNSSPESISNKLDNIYHDDLNKKKKEQNKKEQISDKNTISHEPLNTLQNNPAINQKKKNMFHQNTNQYRNSSKQNEQLKQKLEKSRKLFQKAATVNQEQQSEKTGGLKQTAVKKGLQALGVPSSLANLMSKKMGESNGGKPTITSAAIKPMIPVVGGILVMVLIILVAILGITGSVSEGDISEFNSTTEVKNYITTADISNEDLSEKLVELSLCSHDADKKKQTEECMDSNPAKFIIHLKELYDQYKNYKDINGEEIKLDVQLILETISYNRTDSELFDPNTFDEIIDEMDTLADAMVEKYQERGDLYSIESYTDWSSGKAVLKKRCATVQNNAVVKATNGATVYYRLSDDKYVSYLKYGKVHENFSGTTKVYDTDIHPSSDSSCIPSGRMYKSSDVVRYSGTTSNSSNDISGTTPSLTTNNTSVKPQ